MSLTHRLPLSIRILEAHFHFIVGFFTSHNRRFTTPVEMLGGSRSSFTPLKYVVIKYARCNLRKPISFTLCTSVCLLTPP